MDRPMLVGIQAAMTVVVTDRVRCADVRDPPGFEERDQPCEVLTRNSHRACDRYRERTPHADRTVED
jgi:hypothetical protein